MIDFKVKTVTRNIFSALDNCHYNNWEIHKSNCTVPHKCLPSEHAAALVISNKGSEEKCSAVHPQAPRSTGTDAPILPPPTHINKY